MSNKIDHDKIRRRIMGLKGKDQHPRYDRNKRHPRTTPQMIKFIEDMCKRLDENGIPYQYIFDNHDTNWKFYREDAANIIHSLKTISQNNGLTNDNIRVYHYLVKSPDGKKYVYATSHFTGRPKGFEMLGELRRESVRKDEFKTWPKEKRLQEYKGVSQA